MACRCWVLEGGLPGRLARQAGSRRGTRPSRDRPLPPALPTDHSQLQVWQRVPAFIRGAYVTFCFSDFNLEEKLGAKKGVGEEEEDDDGCAARLAPLPLASSLAAAPPRLRSAPHRCLRVPLPVCPPGAGTASTGRRRSGRSWIPRSGATTRAAAAAAARRAATRTTSESPAPAGGSLAARGLPCRQPAPGAGPSWPSSAATRAAPLPQLMILCLRFNSAHCYSVPIPALFM